MLRSGKSRRGGLCLCALLLCVPVAAKGQDATVAVHIAEKPVADALADFALQAQLSISDSDIDFHEAQSHAIDGTYRLDEALTKILDGTPYGFEFLDASTIRITLDPHEPDSAPMPIENVIVTATKREAIAQALPYSIAVHTGQEIEAAGIHSPSGLTSEVAGMTATNLGPGENKLFIRGLTDSVLPGLSESMVGLYLDETRIADDAPDPDLRLIDIERTEVMRGPQGTLYGAGSLGGLVRIITRKPVLDSYESMMSASASVTEYGAPSGEFDAMMNVPLIDDTLALRAVGYIQRSGGYVDDARIGKKDSNAATTSGGRLALTLKPDDIWTVTANFAIQHIRAQDSQYYIQGSQTFVRDTYLREPHADNFFAAAMTARAAFHWAQFTTATSYVDRRLNDRYDATLAWPDLTGFALGKSPFNVKRHIRAFTNETRLVSTGMGRWQWLAGLYLSHRDEDLLSNLTGPNAAGAQISARNEKRADNADEAALFGEATYAPTDWLSVTAGGRVSFISRHVLANVGGLAPADNIHLDLKNATHGFAPKLVVAVTPVPNTTLYTQYTQGYRFGGINVDAPAGAVFDKDDKSAHGDTSFDSDVLHNYEIGAKWSGFNGRLIANGAVYFTDWKNVQTDQIAANGGYFIANAGTVHDLGAELDIAARPWNDLTIRGNAFWNNAEINHPNPLLTSNEGVLPGAPKMSFAISARYDFPLAQDWDGFASVTYSYVGKSHLGFDQNSAANGGYHLTNLRMGIMRQSWSLTLFVDNVTDNKANTFAFGNPFNQNSQTTPPRPRTIGLTLTANQ